MGQKNPIGLRLGINRGWDSTCLKKILVNTQLKILK